MFAEPEATQGFTRSSPAVTNAFPHLTRLNGVCLPQTDLLVAELSEDQITKTACYNS